MKEDLTDALAAAENLRKLGATELGVTVGSVSISATLSEPRVQMNVTDEPLPDDPDLREKELRRRQEEIDFLSS